MAENTAISPETRMVYSWLTQLMNQIDANLSDAQKASLLKGCALGHYRAIDMDATLAPFKGDLPAFMEFLSTRWGWVVRYEEGERVIIADENKDECVCPLVRQGLVKDLTFLCACSEGFAERMFSQVVGRPVTARVQQSILRGAPTCVYRVTLD